jgi:hypothetical protein
MTEWERAATERLGTIEVEGGFRTHPGSWIAIKVTTGANGDLTLYDADMPFTEASVFVIGRAQFSRFWEAFIKKSNKRGSVTTIRETRSQSRSLAISKF